MKTKQLLKQIQWDDIFGNTSQYENLYCFLHGDYGIKEFINGFYPKSRNKKLIKNNLTLSKSHFFKKHAKKIWNLAKVQQLRNGDEDDNIIEYLEKL